MKANHTKFLISIVLIFIITLITPTYGENKIDINAAEFESLVSLPGIDAILAANIYKYRKNKKFKTIYDLMQVEGMTGEIFQKILSQITVSNSQITSTTPEPVKKPEKLPKKRITKMITPNSGLSTGRRASNNNLRRISRQKLTPMTVFKAGFGLARRGKYKMAEKMFSQFIISSPTHKLINDARYLKGTCFEESEKFNQAIEEYEIIYNNKYSQLRGIALMRIGICYDLLENYDTALTKYKQFQKEFPDSQWLSTVSDRLKELLN